MLLARKDDFISVTDASRRGLSALVRDVEAGQQRILMRNNRPVAAVISIERLERLRDVEDTLLDVTLLTTRMLTATGRSHTLDEVLAHLRLTRVVLLAESLKSDELFAPASAG